MCCVRIGLCLISKEHIVILLISITTVLDFSLVQVSNSLRGPVVGAPTIGTLGIYLLIEVPEPFINNPRLEQ
jgi:hypothetical protein